MGVWGRLLRTISRVQRHARNVRLKKNLTI